jgi:tetratricopeptide (TPR) repeat protein
MKYLIFIFLTTYLFQLGYAQKSVREISREDVEINSYNAAQKVYKEGHKAFVKGKFSDAIIFYQKVDEYIDKNPDKADYFDHKYRDFSMVEMVKKRAELGEIKPKWEHRVLIIFVNKVSAPYQGNRIETIMDDKYRRSAVLASRVCTQYAEVLSNGKLTMVFDTVTIHSTITRIEDDGLVPADRIIYSLEPYPSDLLKDNIDKYDSFLFVWNHKNEKGQSYYNGYHGWGGVNNIAFQPFVFEGPVRGRIIISTGLIERPGTIFHELFHTLEKCYGITPIHGFLDENRSNFPEWKGNGEMDYYQFQLDQIAHKGFGDFCLRKKQLYREKSVNGKIDLNVSYGNRLEARELLLEVGNKDSESKEQAFERAIALNPYDSKIRMEYAVFLHNANRKSEAFDQIQIAYNQSPFDAEVCYWMGVESYHKKDYKASIRYLEEALELNNKMNKAQKYLDFVNAKR